MKTKSASFTSRPLPANQTKRKSLWPTSTSPKKRRTKTTKKGSQANATRTRTSSGRCSTRRSFSLITNESRNAVRQLKHRAPLSVVGGAAVRNAAFLCPASRRPFVHDFPPRRQSGNDRRSHRDRL